MKTFKANVIDLDGCPAAVEVQAETLVQARLKVEALVKPALRKTFQVIAIREVRPTDPDGTEA